jgi:hypothetical protein
MKSHYAFGLPSGSVRALLALGTFGAIWAWMWRRPDVEVPPYLRDLMFIIMGHYFAARHQEAGDVVGPAPLYLPRGSVRTVLLGGFAVLAAALIYRHRIGAADQGHARLSHAGVTLILVAGFMLGVLISHLRRHGVSRRMEDFRAALSLTAGVLLILMVFGFVHVPDAGRIHEFKRWALYYRVEDLLAAMVGFYFGSKS